MLLNLTKLLRASLQQTRENITTLADELELVQAYLEIQAIRMDTRLVFQFHIDPSVRSLPIAPLLLQPLVENALKHGIDPLEQGGEIIINAVAREQSAFTVSVSDTGVGIAATTSGGIGIKNVQQRLQARYGDNASLSFTENQPRGTVATLTLPKDNK